MSQHQPTVGEDEYISPEDGLIHCAVCHQARQAWVHVVEPPFLARTPCPCQQQEERRREERDRHQDFLAQLKRRRSYRLQDPGLRRYTFAQAHRDAPELERARAYVDRWEEMEEQGLGLLLWGDVGTGKSFFAGCVANALLRRNVPVLMTNFSRIFNELGGMSQGERNAYLRSLNFYRLLILDDLGIERSSAFALEQIYQVVNDRYVSGRPLIVTTNLTLRELKEEQELPLQRIYSRILERCVPLKLNRRDFRQQAAGENLRTARQLLTASPAPLTNP